MKNLKSLLAILVIMTITWACSGKSSEKAIDDVNVTDPEELIDAKVDKMVEDLEEAIESIDDELEALENEVDSLLNEE